jgi:hypothetical protein
LIFPSNLTGFQNLSGFYPRFCPLLEIVLPHWKIVLRRLEIVLRLDGKTLRLDGKTLRQSKIVLYQSKPAKVIIQINSGINFHSTIQEVISPHKNIELIL